MLQHEFEVVDEPSRIQFSDGGEYVAVACYQHRSVQVYCLKTGEIIGTYFHTENDEIFSSDAGSILAVPLRIDGLVMCFSSDAQYLVTTAVDLVVRIWDLRRRHVTRRFKGHKENITCLSISADGNYLAAGSGKKLLLWDLKAEDAFRGEREVIVATIEIDVKAMTIGFSPDSSFLAIKADDGRIYLLGANKWKVIGKFESAKLQVVRGTRRALRFSRDGSTLTSASELKVQQWDVSRFGREGKSQTDGSESSDERLFQLRNEGHWIAYNSSTHWVVTENLHSELTLYNLKDMQPRFTMSNSNGFLGQPLN